MQECWSQGVVVHVCQQMEMAAARALPNPANVCETILLGLPPPPFQALEFLPLNRLPSCWIICASKLGICVSGCTQGLIGAHCIAQQQESRATGSSERNALRGFHDVE